MNLEADKMEKKAATPEQPTVRGALRSLPARLWRVLMRNLPLKLLAVFLAVCLWAGLITQDPTLTRERAFNDVQVSMLGTETLRRNGFIILSDFESQPLTARLRVDVPQREYNTVSASNYSPRIDLSKITETGIQSLKISTTSTTAYGAVREVSPDSVEVVVDEYITNYRVPVSVERSGQFPKGFYGAVPSLNPAYVTVSGPKTIVDQMARVIVDFDVSRLPSQAGLVSTAAPMRFMDRDGNPIESSLIEVTSSGVLLRSIVIEQTLFPTKTLPINSLTLTTGKPLAGYEVKSVTATPNVIVAAGDDIGLSALDSLFLEKAVDVSGRSETFTEDVDIRQPAELVYLSAKSIALTIEIGPVISVKKFDNLKFTVVDKTEGRSAHTDQKTVSVTLTGPATLLNALKPTELSAYVDISELAPGEHDLPILLDINNENMQDFTYDISPKLVKLLIAVN